MNEEEKKENLPALTSAEVQKGKAGRPPIPGAKEHFIHAFGENNFSVRATAKAVGIVPNTYYEWLRTDKEFRSAVEHLRGSVRENLLDLAEDAIKHHLEMQSLEGAKVTLRMLGRARGYGDSVDVTSGGDKLGKIDIFIHTGGTKPPTDEPG